MIYVYKYIYTVTPSSFFNGLVKLQYLRHPPPNSIQGQEKKLERKKGHLYTIFH